LFGFFDADSDGTLSLKELQSVLTDTSVIFESQMLTFSASIEKELADEIRLLFDKLDTDKNRYLSAEELVVMMK
jgi:Ca2+-binding EF-hand superfamily protein